MKTTMNEKKSKTGASSFILIAIIQKNQLNSSLHSLPVQIWTYNSLDLVSITRQTQFVLKLNKKSYAFYQTVTSLMTLNDP